MTPVNLESKKNTQLYLLDGSMGQELIHRSGLKPTPLWATQVMLDMAHLVEELHLEYIQAGAEIITLNTYTATPQRLARDAAIELLPKIYASAIQAAQNARQEAIARAIVKPGKVQIAGCLPPLVASYRADVSPNFDECFASYQQLVSLQSHAVDLFLCETMSSINEATAAARAAQSTSLPVWVSFTLQDDISDVPKLRGGELLSLAITEMNRINVDGVLINCSSPETIQQALPLMAHFSGLKGAYANGFVSVDALAPGGTVAELKARTQLTPKLYAAFAQEWLAAGLTIIGGCCEVGPAHIRYLAEHIQYNLS